MSPAPPAGGRRLEAFLHILALGAIAIAQPLLDVLARQPAFFAVRRFGPGEIVALALAATLLVPLPLALAAALPRPGSRAAWAIRLALVFLLGAAVGLLVARRAGADGWAWLAVGAALGAAATAAYARWSPARQFVTWLGVGLVAIPAVFLLTPGIRRQLRLADPDVSAPPSGATTPIVMVVADELALASLLAPDGRIDGRVFPHLAELAGLSTWFANAFAVSDITEHAVPALLTGRSPRSGALPIERDHPRNLFTALPDYRIWASEPITRLRAAPGAAADRRLRTLPSDLAVLYAHVLLPPRWRGRLPNIADRWQGFAVPDPQQVREDQARAERDALLDDRGQQFDRLLAALDPAPQPALWFLHVLLPHTPWEYLPAGRRYLAPWAWVPGLEGEIWSPHASFALEACQRYLLQLQYLDRRMGDLVARLRELGLYDRALLVFVADHGTSFRPGGQRRFLAAGNEAEILPVPLIVKLPGQVAGRVIERRVSTLDVLPTIFDAIGARPPWRVDGRSLLPDGAGSPVGPVLARYLGRTTVPAGLVADPRASSCAPGRFEIAGEPPARIALPRPPGSPLGRRLAELAIDGRPAGRVVLEAASGRAEPEPEPVAPGWIGGHVEIADAGSDCCELLVAVNGTVVAATRAEAAAGRGRFGVLAPAEAFHPGDNRIEVLLAGSGPQAALRSLRDDADAARPARLLAGADGAEVAVERRGAEIRLSASAFRGFVEVAERGDPLRVTGWAVDVERRTPPREILVFHDRLLVATGTVEGARPDVNRALGIADPTTLNAFEISVPRSRVPALARAGVRVVALAADGRAGLLGHTFRLEHDPAPAVVASDGRRYPLRPGAVAGYVEVRRPVAAGLELEGWAADGDASPPAVLAFAGEKHLVWATPHHERGDVTIALGLPGKARPGFVFFVPSERLPEDLDTLRVFGLSSAGEAAELPLLPAVTSTVP